MTNYILSPCAMAAEGLTSLMMNGGQRPVWLQPNVETRLSIPTAFSAKEIVVFIPNDPLWMLLVLREASRLLSSAKPPLSMVLLSRSPAPWLWKTMLHQVGDQQLLEAVKMIPSDLPWCQLETFLVQGLSDYPTLRQISAIEIQAYYKTSLGLGKEELNTVFALLHEQSIISYARTRGVSLKTLYSQKKSGLNKIVAYHPHFAAYFPGFIPKRILEQDVTELTVFEREFIFAIHAKQIFPVFQPIVDYSLRLKGGEVLSRWKKSGVVLYPGEFLPYIRSEFTWFLLTFYILQEAVKNINRYKGMVYFSINIPPCVANHDNLCRIMDIAKKKLKNQQWVDRLVLEFSESIDFQYQRKAVENIENLQRVGFRIFLDDCFSLSSVVLPVRMPIFNGYKLDMSVVCDLQNNPKISLLIKSLVYYCRLVQSHCIAEGIDSLESFNRFKELGVKFFQGDLFSSPVAQEDLDDVYRRFYHNVNS